MNTSLNDDRSFLPMPGAPHPSVSWTFTLRRGGISEGPWGACAAPTDGATPEAASPSLPDAQGPRQTGSLRLAPSSVPADSCPIEAAPGGLNLGIHCGDDPAAVHENRRRLEQAIGQPISWLKQVHGIRVLDLDEDHTGTGHIDRGGFTRSVPNTVRSMDDLNPGPSTGTGTGKGSSSEAVKGAEPEADAQIITRPGIALAVQVADCLPVLLADRQGRVIGAAHAGWRSLAGGILQATVGRMRRKVPDADIVAWLGPCIGPGVFEVGDEVRAAFMAAETHHETAGHEAGAASAFRPGQHPGKWLADLPRLARQHLQALGITDIHTANACTFSDPRRFWSYRRDRICGRMAGLIWLRP